MPASWRPRGVFQNAFADKPALAESASNYPADRPRFFAACCAAKAGQRQGDADRLTPEERAQWRAQALAWLRQELVYWEKQIADQGQVARTRTEQVLSFWLTDGWLAGVRDEHALALLPPAEREGCHQLWAEVAGLLQQLHTAP